MGGFLERWSKEFVRLWKEYVCPVKNHWYKKRGAGLATHSSGAWKGRWPSREVRIEELSQVGGQWWAGVRPAPVGARLLCLQFPIPRSVIACRQLRFGLAVSLNRMKMANGPKLEWETEKRWECSGTLRCLDWRDGLVVKDTFRGPRFHFQDPWDD